MIRFREATQGDLKGLLALYTQLNDNTMPEIDGRVTGTWERMLRQEQLHTLVAEEGGALLSTVTLIITESLTHGAAPFCAGGICGDRPKSPWPGPGILPTGACQANCPGSRVL